MNAGMKKWREIKGGRSMEGRENERGRGKEVKESSKEEGERDRVG